MTDTTFTIGDEVITATGRGAIIDLRATPAGKWLFGVEDSDGAVGYFTAAGLRHASE